MYSTFLLCYNLRSNYKKIMKITFGELALILIGIAVLAMGASYLLHYSPAKVPEGYGSPSHAPIQSKETGTVNVQWGKE